MILRIDFDSYLPIYMQIRNQIIKGIAKGEIESDEELPSVRGLAEDIGVNMHTVNKSYALLKDEGYIKIDRRKGAVIALNLQGSLEKFEDKLNYELDNNIAECLNRGISKEELKHKIDEIYKGFGKII